MKISIFQQKNWNLPILHMLVAGVVASFLVIYPLAHLIYGSLRTSMPGEPGTFTLNNFIEAFTSHKILPTIINTFSSDCRGDTYDPS